MTFSFSPMPCSIKFTSFLFLIDRGYNYHLERNRSNHFSFLLLSEVGYRNSRRQSLHKDNDILSILITD